jgi:hypothetical protein
VSAGRKKPWHADTVSNLGPGHAFADLVDDPGDFMAKYAWKSGYRNFSLDNAEIAATHTAGVDFDENFSAFGLRNGTLFDHDGGIHFWGDNGSHVHLLVEKMS